MVPVRHGNIFDSECLLIPCRPEVCMKHGISVFIALSSYTASLSGGEGKTASSVVGTHQILFRARRSCFALKNLRMKVFNENYISCNSKNLRSSISSRALRGETYFGKVFDLMAGLYCTKFIKL